jgi:Arc/MetJ-type ribon-helix-helix transcriptional regulator
MARAAATVRQPHPNRLREAERRKPGYRVITVSLYTPEAEWIDHMTQMLQQAGNPKANRSLVIREAIARLQEDLQDKSPHEALQDFIARHVARTPLP